MNEQALGFSKVGNAFADNKVKKPMTEVKSVARDFEISKTIGSVTVAEPKLSVRDANVFYGEKQAIFNVSLDIAKNEVIAMIGPSGCGKSTFLRCLNRMNA